MFSRLHGSAIRIHASRSVWAASGTRLLLPRASVRQSPQTPIRFPAKDSEAAYRLTGAHAMLAPRETTTAFPVTTRGLRNIRTEEIRRGYDAIAHAPSNRGLAGEGGGLHPLSVPPLQAFQYSWSRARRSSPDPLRRTREPANTDTKTQAGHPRHSHRPPPGTRASALDASATTGSGAARKGGEYRASSAPTG